MIDQQPLAALDGIGKRLLVLFGPACVGLAPWGVLVVEQQDIVLGKIVRGQIFVGRFRYVHFHAGLGEQIANEGRGRFPIVAVIAGDDEDFDFLFLISRKAVEGQDRQCYGTDHEQASHHGGVLPGERNRFVLPARSASKGCPCWRCGLARQTYQITTGFGLRRLRTESDGAWNASKNSGMLYSGPSTRKRAGEWKSVRT